jgi:hypothetical protein
MTDTDNPKEFSEMMAKWEEGFECAHLLPRDDWAPVDDDEGLEALKRELLGEQYFAKPSTEDYATKVLKDAIGKLDRLSAQLRWHCQSSKAKAIKAHQKAQRSLKLNEMDQVFQHSVDKAVHIRFVKTMEPQLKKIESDIAILRTSLEQMNQSM